MVITNTAGNLSRHPDRRPETTAEPGGCAGAEPAFDPRQRQAFATPVRAEPPRRSEEPLPGYLDQDATRFFYKWGGHLSAALVRLRARFDGDFDQYLIHLVFVLAELSRTIAAAERRAPPPAAPRGLNALSVADITRIPRETTRRKLQALTTGGYLVRGEDGLYHLSGRYGPDELFADLKPLFWDAVKLEGPA